MKILIKAIIFMIFSISGFAFDFNYSEKSNINNSDIVYYFRYDYVGGWTQYGFLDNTDSGKLYLRTSLTGSFIYNDLIKEWGIGAGYDYISVEPPEMWNEKYNEKNFKFEDKSFYLSFIPPSFKEEKGVKTISVGRKFIKISPPEFDSDGIAPSQVADELSDFNKRNSDWKKARDWGWTLGITKINQDRQKLPGERGEVNTKNFWSVFLFEADGKLGVHIKVREDPPYIARMNIPVFGDVGIVGYISPLNIVRSFEILWWQDRGWRVNWSILGIYF